MALPSLTPLRGVELLTRDDEMMQELCTIADHAASLGLLVPIHEVPGLHDLRVVFVNSEGGWLVQSGYGLCVYHAPTGAWERADTNARRVRATNFQAHRFSGRLSLVEGHHVDRRVAVWEAVRNVGGDRSTQSLRRALRKA